MRESVRERWREMEREGDRGRKGEVEMERESDNSKTYLASYTG